MVNKNLIIKEYSIKNTDMHEYLRDTIANRYDECKSCNNRTEFTCVRCNYCWSCLWKKEIMDKKEKEKEMTAINRSQSLLVENKGILNSSEIMNQLRGDENISNLVQMINVFGEQIEPVCNYYRCHHKFSDHGYKSHSSCKCKHPQNSIAGIGANIQLLLVKRS